MEELTALQTFICLGVAAISVLVFANALLDVYVRPSTTRFFYPRNRPHPERMRPRLDD
jgi:hypothetical protein